MKNLLLFSLAVLWAFSCTSDHSTLTVSGMKPIYISSDEMKIVQLEETREIVEPGKIVYRPPQIFLVEKWQGVHVIDNSDPANPVFSAFIAIPGAVDIAVKGNILYADNYRDLISIDLEDLSEITIIDRESNVFPQKADKELPDDYFGYYDCPDSSKGIVIGWEKTTLTNPKCKMQ